MFRLMIRMLMMAMALVIIQASSINGVPVPARTTTRAPTKTKEEDDPVFMARKVGIGMQALQFNLPAVPKKVQKGLETFTSYSIDLTDQFRRAMNVVVRESTSKTMPGIDMVMLFLKTFVKLIEPSTSTSAGKGSVSKIKGKGRKIEDTVLAALKPVVDFLDKQRGKGTLARDVQKNIDTYVTAYTAAQAEQAKSQSKSGSKSSQSKIKG